MKNAYTSFLVLCLVVAHVAGDLGPCRFDPDRCSCKIGPENQGICWDKIVGQPGMCTRRFCKAGWTCACGGRTHVCYLAPKNVNVVNNLPDVAQATAACQTASSSLVNSREISLGTFKIHISKNGVLADDCTQIAWWHNGILLGNHKLVPSMSALVVDTEHSKREDHSLLELRPGDLLAFRFKEASYYCYKHFSEMLVNGTEISTNTGVTTTHYSREYSQDWFLPSFTLTEANTAADESETDLKKFLPLRKTKFSGSPISNGTDHWEPRDDTNADNKRSNWYYRIQIADTISGPTSVAQL